MASSSKSSKSKPSQPKPTTTTPRPPADVLTLSYNKQMVYIPPGENYDQTLDYTIEAYPDLRQYPRDAIYYQIAVNISSTAAREKVRISPRAWKTVLDKLTRYEVINVQVDLSLYIPVPRPRPVPVGNALPEVIVDGPPPTYPVDDSGRPTSMMLEKSASGGPLTAPIKGYDGHLLPGEPLLDMDVDGDMVYRRRGSPQPGSRSSSPAAIVRKISDFFLGDKYLLPKPSPPPSPRFSHMPSN